MLNRKAHYSEIIKSKAKDLGFLSCGIAKAGFLEKEAPKLEQWLQEGRHGNMVYMENQQCYQYCPIYIEGNTVEYSYKKKMEVNNSDLEVLKVINEKIEELDDMYFKLFEYLTYEGMEELEELILSIARGDKKK